MPLSSLVSWSVKMIQKTIPEIDLIVSFADWTFDHHGGIYQACSWNYDGPRSAIQTALVIDGVRFPCRTAVARFGSRSVSRLKAIGIDAEPVIDAGKFCYWKALSKSGETRAVRFGLERLPYPKPDDPSTWEKFSKPDENVLQD